MHTDNAPQTEVCQPHIVSVRSLVEFVLQAGDLTSGGFQRRDRAQLGTQGHKRVQRSRPEGYETEVEIAYRVEELDSGKLNPGVYKSHPDRPATRGTWFLWRNFEMKIRDTPCFYRKKPGTPLKGHPCKTLFYKGTPLEATRRPYSF